MGKGEYTKVTKVAGSVRTMLEEMHEASPELGYRALIDINRKTFIRKAKLKDIRKYFPTIMGKFTGEY